jgi:hypothetical protein
MRLVHLVRRSLLVPNVPALGGQNDERGAVSGVRTGKSNRGTCPSQIPAWPDLDWNSSRRGEKPVNKRLRYGTALQLPLR